MNSLVWRERERHYNRGNIERERQGENVGSAINPILPHTDREADRAGFD